MIAPTPPIRTALFSLCPPRLCGLILLLALCVPTGANNIDLATVPGRDSVQLTIYNEEDLTLVRETRTLTFQRGHNPLQFSWANTLIDPTSVEVRFLDHADRLTLLETTFPHDKPQELSWNIQSEIAGPARVEISYFTSGIDWKADYVGVADSDEAHLALTGYVTVKNNSGEDYPDAQVRLVVGKINLVEKIAELAKRGVAGIDRGSVLRAMTAPARLDADERMLRRREAGVALGAVSGVFADALEAKAIVKEGLSEYFIFTIDGTETIPNGWSKRLEATHTDAAPIKTPYRYRALEYGDQLVRLYLLTHDDEAGLGDAPLPNGAVRLFRRNADDTLSYLTRVDMPYIPVGEKIELNLGRDPNVVFDLDTLHAFRSDFIMKLQGADVYRELPDNPADPGRFRIEVRSDVAGWHDHAVYAQRIHNFTARPIEVEVRRTHGGDTTFISRLDPTRHNANTAQYTVTLQPGEKAAYRYEVVTKQGKRSEQNRLALEPGDPTPAPWE